MAQLNVKRAETPLSTSSFVPITPFIIFKIIDFPSIKKIEWEGNLMYKTFEDEDRSRRKPETQESGKFPSPNQCRLLVLVITYV